MPKDSVLVSQIESLGLLGDPTRRDLYFHVCAETAPVSRDQAAKALGVKRALAAFHLDRLVREGWLEASYRRLSGKTGPGAGRTSKLYSRSGKGVFLALPPRNYELLARLQAATLGGVGSGEGKDDLESRARDYGIKLGTSLRAEPGAFGRRGTTERGLLTSLKEEGFEPRIDGDMNIRLRNCPFYNIASEYTELVCGMNLALMQGIVKGAGISELQASLDPREGECCVAFQRRRSA